MIGTTTSDLTTGIDTVYIGVVVVVTVVATIGIRDIGVGIVTIRRRCDCSRVGISTSM